MAYGPDLASAGQGRSATVCRRIFNAGTTGRLPTTASESTGEKGRGDRLQRFGVTCRAHAGRNHLATVVDVKHAGITTSVLKRVASAAVTV